MTNYQITRLTNGWYSFCDLPQGYIKINALNCGTDRKAINRARKILGDKQAPISIK